MATRNLTVEKSSYAEPVYVIYKEGKNNSEENQKDKTMNIHQCSYCDNIFDSIDKLEIHNKKRCVDVYKCKFCDAKFDKKQNYDGHMNKKKPCIGLLTKKVDALTCSICNNSFSNSSNMKKHELICEKKNDRVKILENKNIQLQKELIYTKMRYESKLKMLQNELNKIKKTGYIPKEKKNDDSSDESEIDSSEEEKINLINFYTKDCSRQLVKNIINRRDIIKITDLICDKNYDELIEFMVNKIHFNDSYKQGQNIKYISKIDKYSIYNNSEWKTGENIKTIMETIQKEIWWGFKSALDSDNNSKITNELRQNIEPMYRDTFYKTYSDIIKKCQENKK